MHNFELVIFDFDGTILDNENLRFKTYQELFYNKFGIKISSAMQKEVLGNNQLDNIKLISKKYGIVCNHLELAKEREKLLNICFSNKKNISLVSGLRKFLIKLKSSPVVMVIASNSNIDYIQKMLRSLSITKFFDEILTPNKLVKPKPNPDMFNIIAKKYAVKNEYCLVIEDSLPGIIATKKAGMFSVGLTTTLAPSDLHMADIISKNYIELYSKLSFAQAIN